MQTPTQTPASIAAEWAVNHPDARERGRLYTGYRARIIYPAPGEWYEDTDRTAAEAWLIEQYDNR